MQNKLREEIREISRSQHKYKFWQRLVAGLCSVVVFVTTYALILPALTIQGEAFCTTPEHVHDDGCYVTGEATLVTVLNCQAQAHRHSGDCRGGDGSVACAMADFFLHSHSEICWDGEGNLLCQLPEVWAHSHGEQCYSLPEIPDAHTHGEGCYTIQTGALICEAAETEGHIHGEGCFTEETLTCELEEAEAHFHGEGCWETQQVLTCTLEETEAPEPAEPVLICTQTELTAHTHSEGCYADGIPVCGKPEVHIHSHGEACMETLEVPGERILVCEEIEHIHSLICYTDPTADLETAADWERNFAGLTLNGDEAENLLAVARTQTGYTESTDNYIVLEDGVTIRGYTRYGAWAGDAYADWSSLFVCFCLHYAGIHPAAFPRGNSVEQWMDRLRSAGLFAKQYDPKPGDLIFIGKAEQKYAGIVTAVNGEGYITALLGDYHNQVRSETFTRESSDILGYGRMLREEAPVPETEATESTEAAEETEFTETTEETQPTETTEAAKETILTADIPLEYIELEPTADGGQTASPYSMLRSESLWLVAAGSGVDLTPYIRDVLINFKEGTWDGTWEKWDDSTLVEDGYLIQFVLQYVLPAGTLSEGNATVVYQLPVEQIAAAKSGYVVDKSGSIVGEYTISQGGLIAITFFDEYVKENAAGVAIEGSISFDSTAEGLDADGDNEIELKFTDSEEVYIKIKDTVQNDLTVAKTASENKEDGTVDYTITVSSVNGTDGNPVTLTDVMNNNTYLSGFKVVDRNGNDITASFTTPGTGHGSFTLNLPAMEAGDSYTITYTAKITSVPNGSSATVTNGVSVKSETEDEAILSDSDQVTLEFEYDLLNKSGTYNSETGMIHWTITLDGSAFDGGLSGWTLTDTFNGKPYTGTVTIKLANGMLLTGQSLPYTFPEGTSGIVTVTYDTVADYAVGASGVTNTATLTPPPGTYLPPFSDTEDYRHPGDNSWEPYNPLNKEAGDVIIAPDHKTAEIQWTLTILPNKGTVGAPWTLTDTLNAGQYFSPEQQTVIESEIARILGNLYQVSGDALSSLYTLEFSRAVYDDSEALLGYREFLLTVNRDLPKSDTAMTISYASTALLEASDTATRFYNTAELNDKVTSVDGITYQPVVSKMDAANDSAEDTAHAWMDLEDGIVSWKIQLYLPAGLNAKVTMIEDLPDAVDLTEFIMTMPNGDAFPFDFTSGDTVKVTARGYELTAVYQNTDGDKKILLEIPSGFADENAEKKILFTVSCKLAEDFRFELEADENIPYAYTVLNNKVHVKYGDSNEDLGSDDHFQYITDEDTTEYIEKQIGTVLNNVVPYSITINPNAEDLNLADASDVGDPEGKWLVVQDILSFWNYNYATSGKYTAALDSSDVFLTLYDADGNLVLAKTAFQNLSGTVAEGSTFSFTQESVEHWGTSTYDSSIIIFRIPDGYKAVLDYQYKFSGQNTSSGLNVSNIAKLQETTLEAESSHSQWIKITESEAEANLSSINIYKVDADNYASHLAGAHYELYKYNPISGQYEFDHVVISNGESELELRDLEINVAYYLVEVQAPAGYILDESRHYFLIFDSTDVDEDGNVNTVQPADFPADAYYPEGGVLYITNTRYTDEITVIKVWQDEDGNTLTDADIPADTSVTVQLMQVYSDYPLDFDYSTIGSAANVSIAVGGYSYTSEVYSGTYAGQVGDTIIITYTYKQVSGETAGLLRITDTENIRIPGSVNYGSDGTVTYTFRYRVTGDAVLRGWVWPENVSGATVTVREDVNYADASITRTVTEYPGGLVTLSAEGRWRYTFANLPAYRLSSTGQIQGYYSYYFNEVSSSLAGYTPTYTGAHSIGTATTSGSVTITNSPPRTTELEVTKEWRRTDGTAMEAPETAITFDLYRVAGTDSPDAPLHLADVVIEIGHWWGGGHEVMNQTLQVLAGSEMKLVLRTGSSAPDITIDGTTVSYAARTPVEGMENFYDYTYYFTADEDLSVYGDVNSNSADASATVINLTEENRTQAQGTKIGSYTLTAANGWKMTITDLPVSAMTTGGMVYYTYFVLETSGGYDVTYKLDGKSYSFCPDVDSGTLTMVNVPWNEEIVTELTVTKKWISSKGESMEARADSINFRLLQIAADDSGEETEREYKIYTLSAENDWTVSLKLPKQSDDGTLTYTYRVEEVTEGYTVTYRVEDGERTDVCGAAESGSITIYNEVFVTVLPNTGGAGTILYTLGGAAMCGWTVLRYNKKKGRKGAASS